MNLTSATATETPADRPASAGHGPAIAKGAAPVRFTKTTLLMEPSGKELDVFKMILDGESIVLLPHKSWDQLDTHKWVARGRLPNSPAGLEITPDHVRIAGETVSTRDSDGAVKLEKAFCEWLELEKETLAMARKKVAARPASVAQAEAAAAPQTPHYRVELDARGQVHIRCVQGKEILAAIGLNAAGFKSLFTQGLMRKPHALQVGALHDWVELDHQLFSFEKGNNDAAKLEKALNEQYLPNLSLGQGKDVVVFTNAASSTGFDIQFPVKVGGVADHRRRPLNEDSLDLLQDPERCGLLHPGIVIKLTRPTLIFKQKTADGGERYLPSSADNLVHTADEEGNEVILDLSQPVNYMRLSTVELTAVFNHPTIHKHGKAAPRAATSGNGSGRAEPVAASAQPPAPAPEVVASPAPPPPPPIPESRQADVPQVEPKPAMTPPEVSQPAASPAPSPEPAPQVAPPPIEPVKASKPTPNAWLADALAKPVIRHDWFSCLVYGRIVEWLENSTTARIGLSNGWVSALSGTRDISDPDFRGFFTTEKGGFGFLSGERLVRFNKGVMFVGTQAEAIEGIGVGLVALAWDQARRIYFIVTEDYRAKFGLSPKIVADELLRLEQHGVLTQSVSEALQGAEPLEVVWTVPAQVGESGEPEVVESRRDELVEATQGAPEALVKTLL